MNMTLLSGVISLAIGIIMTWMSMMLPAASLGMANAPKVFPAGLGILMIGFSLLLIAKESIRIKKTGDTAKEKANPYRMHIILTCLVSILYALLFKKIGYVLSTFLFLELELWLFNGRRNWKINSLVAIAFSLGIYIIFSKLLGVYLPMTPIIWF